MRAILGGDFNCPIDRTFDQNGGILIPWQHAINSIENIEHEFSLHNIWCIKNPNTHSYAYRAKTPRSISADLIFGLFRTNKMT